MTQNKRVMYYKISIKNGAHTVFKFSCYFCPVLSLLALSFIPQRLNPLAAVFTRKPRGLFSQNPQAYNCWQIQRKSPTIEKGFPLPVFQWSGL